MTDIFDHIKAIEKIDKDYYLELSETDRKDVNFYMLLKWLSYTNDAKQLLHINAFLNPKVFPLYAHKDLLYKLCCACAIPKKHSYKWLKRNSSKESVVLKMVAEYNNCGLKEAEEIMPIYSKDDLYEMVEELNLDKQDIVKIKKQIDVL